MCVCVCGGCGFYFNRILETGGPQGRGWGCVGGRGGEQPHQGPLRKEQQHFLRGGTPQGKTYETFCAQEGCQQQQGRGEHQKGINRSLFGSEERWWTVRNGGTPHIPHSRDARGDLRRVLPVPQRSLSGSTTRPLSIGCDSDHPFWGICCHIP